MLKRGGNDIYWEMVIIWLYLRIINVFFVEFHSIEAR